MKTSEFIKGFLETEWGKSDEYWYLCDAAWIYQNGEPRTRRVPYEKFKEFMMDEGTTGFYFKRNFKEFEERTNLRYLYMLNAIEYFKSIDD